MSKRVPELGQTAEHLVGTAAEFGVHGGPRMGVLAGERTARLPLPRLPYQETGSGYNSGWRRRAAGVSRLVQGPARTGLRTSRLTPAARQNRGAVYNGPELFARGVRTDGRRGLRTHPWDLIRFTPAWGSEPPPVPAPRFPLRRLRRPPRPLHGLRPAAPSPALRGVLVVLGVLDTLLAAGAFRVNLGAAEFPMDPREFWQRSALAGFALAAYTCVAAFVALILFNQCLLAFWDPHAPLSRCWPSSSTTGPTPSTTCWKDSRYFSSTTSCPSWS